MFVNMNNFVIFFTLISIFTISILCEEARKLPFDGTRNGCKYCNQPVEEKTTHTDAFLLLKHENVTRYHIISKEFPEVPSPPIIQENVTGDYVKELSPTVHVVPFISPEPKQVPEVKYYNVVQEELEFPEEVTEVLPDDDDDELILTKLRLGGEMSILSSKSGDEIKFGGIDDVRLSCDLVNNEIVKKQNLRGRGKDSRPENKDNSVKRVSLDILRLNNQGSTLDNIGSISNSSIYLGSSSLVSNNETSLHAEHKELKHGINNATVGTNPLNCELCDSANKCFFHRKASYGLRDITTENNEVVNTNKNTVAEVEDDYNTQEEEYDEDEHQESSELNEHPGRFLSEEPVQAEKMVPSIDGNTTTTVTLKDEMNGEKKVDYDTNETNINIIESDASSASDLSQKSVKPDRSRFESNIDSEEILEEKKKEYLETAISDVNKELDIKQLMSEMSDLIKMFKESREEQVRTREELKKERSILSKIAIDLNNTKNTTYLYIQMTKIDMDISLAKQSIDQLLRDKEKNKSTSQLLTSYENQIGIELETVQSYIKKAAEPSKKLLSLFKRISSRKETVQRMQIDVLKRLSIIESKIKQLNEYVDELEKQKKEIRVMIAKIYNEKTADNHVD